MKGQAPFTYLLGLSLRVEIPTYLSKKEDTGNLAISSKK